VVDRPLGAVASATAAITLSYLTVRSGRAVAVDTAVRRSLAPRHGPVVDRVVGVGTDLGSINALAGVCVTLAAAGRRRTAVDLAVAGGAAWIGAQATKPLLDRHRPYDRGEARRLVSEPAGTSWPSGHAALAAAMADTVAPVLPPTARRVAWATALGVGVSRCFVGVHHATDVVAGVGVGVLCSRFARALRRP
jgi:membrane-associated phospholipid phosphatase